MKFGLLCDDPAAQPLLAALHQHPAHSLSRAVLVSPAVDGLLAGLGGVTCVDRWEELLAARDVEVVIVGGAAAEIWDGARQLAQSGVPLLIVPTLAAGETVLYELSLIRDDRQLVLYPAWAHRFDPAIRRVRERLQSIDRSDIAHVELRREVIAAGRNEVGHATLDEFLLRDADLLRFLFGEADQLTTLRTGGTATGAAMQIVKLTGRKIPETTWSIQASATEKSQIAMQVDSETWNLVWHPERSGWELLGSGEADARADHRAEKELLDDFARTVAGQSAACDWSDVLKSLEIVDAARRSLERRRTIELHHELLSERAIFKTQMAAMGCGILLLTLGLMLVYLGVATVIPLTGWMLQTLRILVFAPLFVFLLLQLLLPLTRTAADAGK